MASPLAEAIMSSMVASMDPNAAMTRQALQGFITTQQDQAIVAKSDAAGTIGDKLTQAISNGAPASVIHCYEKLLAQLVQ